MINTGINYFYDFLGLDSSNFKIFYDFNTTNISGGNKIGSIPLGDVQYSGSANVIASTNSSGAFSASRNNLISISNVSQSDFSSDLSFLIKYRSVEPQTAILFSSLTGNSVIKSGFNVGINQANHLFFEYWDNSGPVTLTSPTRIGDSNIISVSVAENNVDLGWYNSNSKQLETNSFYIDSQYLLFSDKWALGGNRASFESSYDFSGYYGAFLAFNTALSRNTMTRLISGIYSYPTVIPAVSGTNISSGIVGYSTSLPNSGVTGFSYSFSGFKQVGSCGDTYPIYNTISVSGTLSSGSGLFPIYGPTTGYYLISGARSGIAINTGILSDLGYNSVSYTWKELELPSREIYNNTGIATATYLNKFANYDIVRGDFSAESIRPSGDYNAFLNGIMQYESGYNITGQFYNVGKSGIADYFIDNQYFDFKEEIFTTDTLIYDNYQLQNRIIKNYSGESSLVVNGSYSLCYGNGQKLISGIDYTVSGNTFLFDSGIRNVLSGEKLLFVSGKQDFQRQTGNNSIYQINKFLPKTTNYYLNGVRHPTEHFIEHSSLSPLSGQYLFAENLNLINNNDVDDWT